jgi:hypothetical protein
MNRGVNLKFFIFFILFSSTLMARDFSKGGLVNATGLLVGYSHFVEPEKDQDNLVPSGASYKLSFTRRASFLESGLILRHTRLDKEISYGGDQATIEHRNWSAGLQVGFWIVPWFNLHGGYASHLMDQYVEGSHLTYTEIQSAKDDFNLRTGTNSGSYWGADLAILSVGDLQIFANYDFYRMHTPQSYEWEIMFGFRFYTDLPQEEKKRQQNLGADFVSAILKAILYPIKSK